MTTDKFQMWFAPEDSCYTSPVRLSMMVDSGYGELRGDPPNEIELITGEYVKPYKTYIYKLVKKIVEIDSVLLKQVEIEHPKNCPVCRVVFCKCGKCHTCEENIEKSKEKNAKEY